LIFSKYREKKIYQTNANPSEAAQGGILARKSKNPIFYKISILYYPLDILFFMWHFFIRLTFVKIITGINYFLPKKGILITDQGIN
jgi:hypothetical protein